MESASRLYLAVLILGASAPAAMAQYGAEYPWIPYDHKAIQYLERTPDDAVAKLEKQLETGQRKLTFDPQHGYLPDLLKLLDINTDSQVLVFSKTSFQLSHISPAAPRALYFSDNVYVGSVQDADMLELVALDPHQGVQFYTMDVNQTAQPRIMRRDMVCLQCHISSGTLNVPGLLVTSSSTSSDGTPFFGSQTITDHRTPLEDRWGGWYVTGTAGSLHHRGNAVPRDPTHTQNLLSLRDKFDTSPYLEPSSDIVALMTLEHQTRMTDLLTRLGWEARVAVADGKTDAFQKRLGADVEDLVRYMLFTDEAKIQDPILGSSTFMRTFPLRGPRDSHGRSLRDFDLHTRLFRYPLSYMIYSEAFDSLPEMVRNPVCQRLYDVLTGKDTSPAFARLSAEDRRNILEIVRETKPNLPAYWRAGP